VAGTVSCGAAGSMRLSSEDGQLVSGVYVVVWRSRHQPTVCKRSKIWQQGNASCPQ
jgi:hypothetical protein